MCSHHFYPFVHLRIGSDVCTKSTAPKIISFLPRLSYSLPSKLCLDVDDTFRGSMSAAVPAKAFLWMNSVLIVIPLTFNILWTEYGGNSKIGRHEVNTCWTFLWLAISEHFQFYVYDHNIFEMIFDGKIDCSLFCTVQRFPLKQIKFTSMTRVFWVFLHFWYFKQFYRATACDRHSMTPCAPIWAYDVYMWYS